VEVAILLHC